MAITTKRSLVNSKFKQEVGDSLNLSGDTKFYGFLSLINGNQGVGNVLVSNADGGMDWEIRGIAGGLATLNSESKLAHDIDASKITSGLIDIARIPHSAIERLVIVANETERFELTIDNVQNGDTVKQNDTGIMYFVVDETNLGNSSGYQIYNAGSAASVEWINVQNKPTDITDLSTHDATELSDISSSGSGNIITDNERTKLNGIEDGAEVNVQSDWNQTNNTSDDYIKNKPSLSAVATSNNYYDLDNIPEYQTIVVNNEAEFTGATVTLTGTAGKILLNDDITLTANREVDLHNVTVDGNRNSIIFNNYKLTLNTNTRKTFFTNIQFRGTKISSEGVDEVLNISADGGYFVFNGVVFRYTGRFDSYDAMLNSTGNTIVFDGSVNMAFESCTTLSDAEFAYYPIFVSVNPITPATDYLHIKITSYGNVRNESYIGFRGDLAVSGSAFYNDITHDNSIPILQGTNFLNIPSNVILSKKPPQSINEISVLDVIEGENATLELTGNKTIEFKNLYPSITGNITIVNATTAYTITLTGYPIVISSSLSPTNDTITMSGNNNIDVLSYYYDGTRVIINGNLGYV